MSDLKEKVRSFLEERLGPSAELVEWEEIGKGTHGAAARLRVAIDGKEERLIIKSLYPSGFGHDHFSDRGRVLILAFSNYNDMERHVKAFDVVGESPDRLVSLRNVQEFHILMQEAGGSPYFADLNAILERGSWTDLDRERAVRLASFLARIHGREYDGGDAKTLYRRRIRDLIGHGECIMGIVDSYDEVGFTSQATLVEIARKALTWWGKIRDRKERLCEVHGDFHPGNIRFHGADFTVLDRARGTWGEPADDVSCLGVNYIYYAVKQTGTFRGPFSDLFRFFCEAYLEETRDREILDLVQPFFAFRVLVIANPRFYPHETDETRRKLLDFGHSVLETERFELGDIPRYLDKR
jgi:hypothetical protein